MAHSAASTATQPVSGFLRRARPAITRDEKPVGAGAARLEQASVPRLVWDAGAQATRGVGSLDEQTRFKKDLIALLPRLRRFARTLTRSQADADDLVQEACVKALARHHQWDRSQGLDGWVFRIARNHWFSELRKRQVRVGQGQVDAADAAELSVPHEGEAKVAMAELRGKVGALPPELATPLLLVCAEGYSYKETAELLDIPVGTVMSRIHRARKALAEGLRIEEHVAT